ncbi:enoyl-CoA hydratase-related protein [Cognatishimia activa]|uniref:enoyl-CoA hydratase-related protein n=1 Tax=Cognatishimia activa TaxID=1715691 RepID=UPI00103C8A8B|nr:enoyl-CoA hydratase-related protein [Cognatishimia activa]
MRELVTCKTIGSVCLIEMDDGRDNRLSRSFCIALTDALKEAFADDAVRLVLLIGNRQGFSVGYALDEISNETAQNALFELVDSLADAPKPVVAAVRGNAFGAGFEIALLCAFRLASPTAQFGFPEVALSLPPGAGATQTLPRLLGASPALALLLDGITVSPDSLGAVVDAEINGDFRSGALRFAQAMAAENLEGVAMADRREGLENPMAFQTDLIAAREARSSDPSVSHDIIKAVECALLLPFHAGLAFEREQFKSSEARPESRGQRHLESQRRLRQRASLNAGLSGDGLERIGVLGQTETAFVIAARLLLCGANVTLFHSKDEAAEDVRFDILDAARSEAEIFGLNQTYERQVADQLTLSEQLEDCATVDMVLDCSDDGGDERERRAVALAGIVPDHASFVSITDQVEELDLTEAFGRVAQSATIWLPNPMLGQSCEFHISRTPDGDLNPVALVQTQALLERLRLFGVSVSQTAGLATTALFLSLLEAAEQIAIGGSAIDTIDRALRGFGVQQGPFELADRVGLDSIRLLMAQSPEKLQVNLPLTYALAKAGEVGLSSQAGFYLYEEDMIGRQNPEAKLELDALRSDAGVNASDEVIVERCLGSLANTGAMLLAEGIVSKPAELDILAVDHLGFKPQTGGPFHSADQHGLLGLRYQLSAGRSDQQPNSHFIDMIKNGMNFNALNAEADGVS